MVERMLLFLPFLLPLGSDLDCCMAPRLCATINTTPAYSSAAVYGTQWTCTLAQRLWGPLGLT